MPLCEVGGFGCFRGVIKMKNEFPEANEAKGPAKRIGGKKVLLG